jgi:hypothetical protein
VHVVLPRLDPERGYPALRAFGDTFSQARRRPEADEPGPKSASKNKPRSESGMSASGNVDAIGQRPGFTRSARWSRS